MTPTTYSFKDLMGVFTHPLAGGITIAGNIGIGQISVSYATEKTATDIAADGSAQISYIAGDNGTITIECQQTSILHKYLLSWFNFVNSAARSGDVSNFANAALTLRNTVDGTGHQCTGGSIPKNPDKAYASQGGKVSWAIPFADIQSSTY
jgi:hypothetical protein